MSLLMARHILPRSLAAFGQRVRVPTFSQTAELPASGHTAKYGRLAAHMRWPINAPVLLSPAFCMRHNSNMTRENEELPLKLHKSLNIIIEDENISTPSIEARVIPPDGGSFMGVLREITIKGKTEEGEKEIDLFVKTMIPDSELTIYSVPGAYEKETTVYSEIFKMFNELQDDFKIPVENRFHMPKTYEGFDNESIIMENLAKKGFSMCKRLEVLPVEFAKLSLKELAKFHGMGFVIQAKRPDFFETKVQKLKQPFYYNTPAWDGFVGNMSRAALTILEPEAKKKMAEYLPTTFEKYSRYAEDPNSVRTFVHGDFRASNLMLKLKDNEISEVMIIDFQQTFYGCPIIDFLYFIFSGTDQEFRKQHLEELKNVYHNSMKEYLKYYDLDIDSYFSRKEFERVYQERLDYGLMISMWLIPIILADKGEVPDVTKVDLNEMNFKFNETVKSRVREAVDDFIQWGYLK